jgi:lipopolysaccharide transport protein LptA
VKIFCYIVVVAMAGAGMLRAQTNSATNNTTNVADELLALVTTNPPASKPSSHPETRIEAEGPADFDLAGRRVIYHEHVRVDSANMRLTCEWLAADLPQTGGRVTNIVAESNVVMDATDEKGQKMHATGDKAVYVYRVGNGVTNETVTLTGNARLENGQGWLTGDSIIWDRVHERLSVPSNPKMIFHQAITTSEGGTNSLVSATNSLATATNSPPMVTNAPAVNTHLPAATANAPTTATNSPTGKPDLTHKSNLSPKSF